MNVGVVGATGQVGRVMLRLLAERNFPVDDLRLFASSRSAGRTLQWQKRSITLEDASKADYHGLDVCLFSAGAAASKLLAPKVADSEVVVIDNSSAWRADPKVPLVVAEVNPHTLETIPKGIVANPNCTTMVAMPPLSQLHNEAGLTAMVVSSYQAVSGAGLAGVTELDQQIHMSGSNGPNLTYNGKALGLTAGSQFVEPIAYNAIPFAGSLMEDGTNETSEEQKLRHESRKILELPNLAVAATCVRIPVYCGHSLSISAGFKHPISPARALEVLKSTPGVICEDVPTPLKAAGIDPSIVGRIRRDPTRKNGLSLFVSGDNLRKGAALNAVQIAETMADRGLLSAKNRKPL